MAKPATILKIGQSNSRKNDKKLEFISLKKTIKVAQLLDTLVILAIKLPITNEDMPNKIKKSKTKTRPSAAHRMTKG